ncbi:osmotically inducible protein OsmC [Solitalea longa]|uniref:Osmotically inducible protein OsmC n=1 Tax=Solitalea longa TaxID=2079460 RepID=A0A2S5AB49_9SPHI|nr:OsmC family protein [Solitalea longa]POY39323.1 osmotically inducible protein OsmC [Solitalea longa]
MATVKTIYKGELRTEATHLQSGTKIITDAPTDNNGKGEAFSPTDLVAAALGSCAMTIMGIVARRENIDLKDTDFSITKIMAAEPRRISEIQVEFNFPKLDIDDRQRQLLENAALTCPVAQSLKTELVQNIKFNWQ